MEVIPGLKLDVVVALRRTRAELLRAGSDGLRNMKANDAIRMLRFRLKQVTVLETVDNSNY